MPVVSDLWYAAYGSNTDADRFSAYLRGCDPPVLETPPSTPGTIDLPLRFAEETLRWRTGGVAFVGPTPGPPVPTLVRLWRLTAPVLAQIGAQENGLPTSAAALDTDAVMGAGAHRAFPGRWYDSWVGCGKMAGIPVVTLTSSVARLPNPPGPRYAGDAWPRRRGRRRVPRRPLRAGAGAPPGLAATGLRARDGECMTQCPRRGRPAP